MLTPITMVTIDVGADTKSDAGVDADVNDCIDVGAVVDDDVDAAVDVGAGVNCWS